MVNYIAALRKTTEAKKYCYRLATEAFNAGLPANQRKLYEIVDDIQVALDKLLILEVAQRKKLVPCVENAMNELFPDGLPEGRE